MRVLIVEDDRAARSLLRFVLEEVGGHTVVEAADGQRGLELAPGCDLAITDLVLPGPDGYSFCRSLRERSAVPILAVSGTRNATQDRVRALETGADAFLPKPFEPTELLARVEALARRARRAAPPTEAGQVRAGRLALDLVQRTATVAGGPAVALTPTECRLLARLARSPGQAVARVDLEQALWGVVGRPGSGTLASYVAALRRKLEPDPRRPRLVLTMRSLGYRLA